MLTLRAEIFLKQYDEVKMIIHLIRHAEKQKGNYYDQILKIENNPITQIGLIQANLLKDHLPKHVIPIYVSRYIRTRQTIVPYAQENGDKIIEDTRIDEINTGIRSRLPEEEIKEKYPEFYKEYQEKKTDFKYPEGECGVDVAFRIESFIKEIFDKDKEVIVIGHEGWIKIFICRVLQMKYSERFRLRVSNCGITTVNLSNKNMDGYILRINECGYLKEYYTEGW
jgi:broad specificity phosphatase PhoE